MSVIYGKKSQTAFATLHPLLQQPLLYIKDVLEIDHSVLCGYRGETSQNALFYSVPQRTKVKYPDSSHNTIPSMAVDVVPYVLIPNRKGGIHWLDEDMSIREMYYREMVRFAAIFQMVALLKFGVKTRWGGDWDKDWSLMDNKFNDYPHHEIVELV